MSSGGGGPAMIPRPVGIRVSGNACVCNEIEICSEVTAPCDLKYVWEINGVPQPQYQDEECIDYEIQNVMPVTICYTAILGSPAFKCDEVTRCTTIVPYLLPPVRDPLEIVCWEDHLGAGYTWYDQTLFSSCINPPCTTQAQDRSGCCYELIQPVLLRNRPSVTVKSVIICDSSELPFITEDRMKWNESVCNEFVYFQDSRYGCDTSYALTINVLDPEFEVDRICDIQDEITFSADVDLNIDCPVGIITYELEWKDCITGNVISNDTFLTVTSPGMYCLDMVISYTNPDGSQGECIKRIGEYPVSADDFGIGSVSMTGDLILCEGEIGTYRSTQTAGINNFNWTIPSNNGVIITPDPSSKDRIEVDWNLMPGDTGIICLEVIEECLMGDTCLKVIMVPRPKPSADPDTMICGFEVNLGGTSTVGSGHWRLISGIGTIDFGDSTLINTSVTADSQGTYQFVWTETAGSCVGRDTMDVTFNEPPESAIIDTICTTDGKRYVIELQVSGGIGPYTIISGGGSIDMGGRYISDTLDNGEFLDLLVRDSLGCTHQLRINHQCDCGPIESGTLGTELIEACRDECIIFNTNNDHTIDAGQCAYVILYRDSIWNASDPFSDTIDVQVLDVANGNEFCFDDQNMMTEEKYYIHYLVTACDQNDVPDLVFACLKTVSQPIIFHDYPEPSLGPDYGLCGLDTFLNVSWTEPYPGEWTLMSGPGNAMFFSTMPLSPLTVDQYGTYVFVWTADNEGCQSSDTLSITFRDSPSFVDWRIECDSTKENFRVIIEQINGGDASTYMIEGFTIGQGNWQPTLINSEYVSPWIMSEDSIRMILSDQFDCFPDTLGLKHRCDCPTALGELMANPLKFCLEGQTEAVYTGGQKRQDDIVVFYLHEGGTNMISNVIDFNTTGVFNFIPGTMNLNQSYWITVRVGMDDGNGEVNENEDCALETDGIEVIWYDVPQAAIIPSQDTFYCMTNSIQLDGSQSINGAMTGQLQYQWIRNDNSQNIGNGDQVDVQDPGGYSLIVTNSITGCNDTMQIMIPEVTGPELIDHHVVQPDCDENGQGQVSIQQIQGGFGPFEWRIENGPFQSVDEGFDLSPGTYQIEVRDRNGCLKDTMITIDQPKAIEVYAREDQYITKGQSINLDTLLDRFVGAGNPKLIWVNENGDSIVVGQDKTLLDSLFKTENRFELIAIDENGCMAIDELIIFVKVIKPTVYIPNAVSTNGDNINDVFRVYISSDDIKHIKLMRIFTRWGELIYQNSQPILFDASGVSLDGWNGIFNGEKVNPGVYVYTVELVDVNDAVTIHAGSVTVLE